MGLAISLDKLLELWEWVGEVKEVVHMELDKVVVDMEVCIIVY